MIVSNCFLSYSSLICANISARESEVKHTHQPTHTHPHTRARSRTPTTHAIELMVVYDVFHVCGAVAAWADLLAEERLRDTAHAEAMRALVWTV
jgi:hypothetical protein